MGLFEMLYYIGYRAKTSLDVFRQKSLPSKVISIGNITTGGTGKTPSTIALAEEAAKRGYSACILTRGYKGKHRDTCVVTPDMSATDAGDEPLLMANRLEDVPVVKDPDRYRGGCYALKMLEKPPELFILDDGFQHRRLHRDVDILLINARDPFNNGKLLPIGRLREPLSQLSRADFIVITKSEGNENDELLKQIRMYNRAARIFVAEHKPSYLLDFSGKRLPISWIKERKIMVFCGIAEPGYFRHVLKQNGAWIVGSRDFRDHYSYRHKDILSLREDAGKCGAECIITTEKDIMRLKDFGIPEEMFALAVDFRVENDFYNQVFNMSFQQEDEC